MPSPSVTFMVKLKVPAVVGVPASWLLLSGALVDTSASPAAAARMTPTCGVPEVCLVCELRR